MPEITIKEICDQRKLKPTQLARQFQIPARTVQQWYKGERKAPEYIISMMVRIFELEKTIAVMQQDKK